MTNVRKFVYAILAVVAAGVAFLGWSVFDTWRRLPEAYAAWDVGTMLICFMERNDNRWPSSWNELADSIKPDDECVFCRGVEDGEDRHHGYPKTIEKLKRMVRIDWNFVPTNGEMQYPITTSDGKNSRWFGRGRSPMKWFTIGSCEERRIPASRSNRLKDRLPEIIGRTKRWTRSRGSGGFYMVT